MSDGCGILRKVFPSTKGKKCAQCGLEQDAPTALRLRLIRNIPDGECAQCRSGLQ